LGDLVSRERLDAVIPVIGIPYISRPDLLARMLETIPRDAVGRIHIIDNSPSDLALRAADDKQLVVTRMHHNMGVAASWNLIIKANPQAAWWAVFNSDLFLESTDLSDLEEAMATNDIVFMGGMHAFGVSRRAIAEVGWFDENFVPAYYEDNDWHWRAQQAGFEVKWLGSPGHFGSHAIRSSTLYAAENRRTFADNGRYYVAKWGGTPSNEVFTTPFDKGGSLRDCTLDITRLAELTWKE
jgi:GT2 family glycosyltransferase